MAKCGKLIVFEGGEGSGKDTHIDRIRSKFSKYGGEIDVVFTREPGGTEIAEDIRDILLNSERYKEVLVPEAELLLFLAGRAQHVRKVVEPSLERGKHVILNRFDLSTMAYQLYGRERLEYLNIFRIMNKFAIAGCVPDLVVLLDVIPEVGLGRKRYHLEKEELSRFDTEELAFHERVRDGYLECIKMYPNRVVIDANRGVECVWVDVFRAVNLCLTN